MLDHAVHKLSPKSSHYNVRIPGCLLGSQATFWHQPFPRNLFSPPSEEIPSLVSDALSLAENTGFFTKLVAKAYSGFRELRSPRNDCRPRSTDASFI